MRSNLLTGLGKFLDDINIFKSTDTFPMGKNTVDETRAQYFSEGRNQLHTLPEKRDQEREEKLKRLSEEQVA